MPPPPRPLNPKRRLRAPENVDRNRCAALARRARYGGNPEHKRNPGDFGLTPPSAPRPGKSLCDRAEILTRTEAHRLLAEGLRRGLISEQTRGDWPQNVWAVSTNGLPLEAQLENPERGTYHGYPMADADPLATAVRERWEETT